MAEPSESASGVATSVLPVVAARAGDSRISGWAERRVEGEGDRAEAMSCAVWTRDARVAAG